MQNETNYSPEMALSLIQRLQSIADRHNANGVATHTTTVESIVAKLERDQSEEDAIVAKQRAVAAERRARVEAETAALSLFKIGDEVTFQYRGKTEKGAVVEINHEGLNAPNLGVWMGAPGQKLTGRALPVKPFEHAVNGLRSFMDGDQHCVVDGTFVDLQESCAGFGPTVAEAVAAFGASTAEVANV